MIQNGDSIIVYARSHVVENLLIEAHKNGKTFTVIVVDNPPFNEGKKLMESLSANGVETIYTLLSNVPYFIKKASKVFVGALSMLTNGALVSRVGTALVTNKREQHHLPQKPFQFIFPSSNNISSRQQARLRCKRIQNSFPCFLRIVQVLGKELTGLSLIQ